MRSRRCSKSLGVCTLWESAVSMSWHSCFVMCFLEFGVDVDDVLCAFGAVLLERVGYLCCLASGVVGAEGLDEAVGGLVAVVEFGEEVGAQPGEVAQCVEVVGYAGIGEGFVYGRLAAGYGCRHFLSARLLAALAVLEGLLAGGEGVERVAECGHGGAHAVLALLAGGGLAGQFAEPLREAEGGEGERRYDGCHGEPYGQCLDAVAARYGVGQFGYVAVAPVDGLEAAGGYAAVAQTHLPEDDSEAVDVVAHVGGGCLHLFGRHVAARAGWLLEDSVAVGVGESEVDEFGVVAVGGDDDVVGLEVAVDDALGVDVAHSAHGLVGEAAALLERVAQLEPLAEGDALHIFHDDAVTESVYGLQSHGGDHGGVLQSYEKFKFLALPLAVGFFVRHLGTESLERPPAAVALGSRHDVGCRRGQYLHIGELPAYSLKRIVEVARR